jgi:DNA-binding transcriptional MerR regulator
VDYSIGRLAELTGLTVKTIRFYSDAGVLPTPRRTAAGYRVYDDGHRARLELIRTLRENGVDLATIRSLGERELRDVLALHLKAVETQLASLQRTRAVLRVALVKDEGPIEDDLRRLHALGRVGAAEMAALLEEFIDEVGGEVAARREWLSCMREAMLPTLPEEPTTRQLDAWLELADLLADGDFRENLRRQSEAFWSEPRDQEAWQRGNTLAMEAANTAISRNIAPNSPEAGPILDQVLVHLGQTRAELLRAFDEHDRRAERHWELLAIIRDTPWPPASTVAYRWIETASRHSHTVIT